MLGRCLPAAEADLRTSLLAVPDVVAVRLVGRPVFVCADGGPLPEVALDLEPEAAVWLVRLAGILVGRVDDFDLGLANPSGETLVDASFLVGFFSAVFLWAFGVVDRRDAGSDGLLAGFDCVAGVVDLTGWAFAVFRAVPAAGFVAFVLSTPFRVLVTAAPPLVPLLALPPVGLLLPPSLRPSEPVPASL